MSVLHTFCPIPSSLSDNSLRGCWAKELDVTSLSLPLPQFLCPSASLYGDLSLWQMYDEGKKIPVPLQFPTSSTHLHQVNWKAALSYFTYWSTTSGEGLRMLSLCPLGSKGMLIPSSRTEISSKEKV